MPRLSVGRRWLEGTNAIRVLRVPGIALAVLSLLGLACVDERLSQAPDAGAGDSIRLAVVIVIDQLRPERINPDLPGGLGRLMREGHNFPRAEQNHARTETCPGHATILTGRHPGAAGIPSNDFIDRTRKKEVYCVLDETEQGQVLGEDHPQDPHRGRSPRSLRVETLGDWLKKMDPDSRVFAISAKDRAAILLAGHGGDAAYWLDRKHTGRFTTSRFYRDSLPEWVGSWSPDYILSAVPSEWIHAPSPVLQSLRSDDHPGEDEHFNRTTPHPIHLEGSLMDSIEAFSYTPYLDQRTLDFARQLVEEEDLGQEGRTDLLALSLSGTDLIGHAYGPYSHESADALRMLDEDLGRFLDFLEARVGREHMLVVLTSDHGVLALPEWLEANSPPCPIPSGRLSPKRLGRGLADHLNERFGMGSSPRFLRNHMGFFFLPEAGKPQTHERIRAAADWLGAQPGVARVISRDEIESGSSRVPLVNLHAQSLAPGLGPDLFVETEYGCLFSDYPTGTSHGSSHDYDRRVPLVFFGGGIEPGETWMAAKTVDIAPTLAWELGLPTPGDLDGEILPLAE